MKNKPERVCWDSSVIIDYLQQYPSRYADISPMIEQAENGELLIIVSEFSIAEVNKLRMLENNVSIEGQRNLISEWFERDYIIPRVVDRGVSFLASQLQADYDSLKPADAVITATAIKHQAVTLFTYDGCKDDGSIRNRRLLKLDGIIPTGSEGQFLQIIIPNGRTDGKLHLPEESS
jgi:predicted nucleic acid-binding protein